MDGIIVKIIGPTFCWGPLQPPQGPLGVSNPTLRTTVLHEKQNQMSGFANWLKDNFTENKQTNKQKQCWYIIYVIAHIHTLVLTYVEDQWCHLCMNDITDPQVNSNQLSITLQLNECLQNVDSFGICVRSCDQNKSACFSLKFCFKYFGFQHMLRMWEGSTYVALHDMTLHNCMEVTSGLVWPSMLKK